MSSRPSIPRNVERALWAESNGYCPNPKCEKQLIMDDEKTNIAEIAHIVPHAEGGDMSTDNLILLCKNCHKEYEPIDRPTKADELKAWKHQRRQSIEKNFAVKFKTFDELSAKVKPLLEENYRIFTNYGPHTNDPESFKLWQNFEHKLIINNTRLKHLFDKNVGLFPDYSDRDNAKIIHDFISHVDEFHETREGFDGVRKKLFPDRLLSIFGIEQESGFLAQNVSAIQNLIKAFQDKGFHVQVNLIGHNPPHLIIDRGGEIEKLSLNDEPRVSQLFFSEWAYRPRLTDVRLDNLLFNLGILEDSGARWSFDNVSDLTVVTINDSITVKLFYSYVLSMTDLESTNLGAVKYVANLYSWNGGESTKEAQDYAESINITVMNSKKFIRFCKSNPS